MTNAPAATPEAEPTACWTWCNDLTLIGWALIWHGRHVGYVRRITTREGRDEVYRWDPLNAQGKALTSGPMRGMHEAKEAVRNHAGIPVEAIRHEPHVRAIAAVPYA